MGPPSGRLLLPAFPALLFQVLGCELHLLLREQDMVSPASLGGGPQGAPQRTLRGRRLALLLQVWGRTLGTEEPGPLTQPEASRESGACF